ncbi:MAG: arginine--tRNA ligase [Candidatus Melainabacteria bacterium]|nr:arginine--tRNA ligase [Candidatus Melainabacteria bacterium]
MLSSKIRNLFQIAINKAIAASDLGELKSFSDYIDVERCKNPDHGDIAVSIALKLSREAKLAPVKIAQSIVKHLDVVAIGDISIAGPGFINIRLNWDFLESALVEIHQEKDNYGRLSKEARADMEPHRFLIEYVSANPTGNLHLGHGRQAVLGNSLARLLDWAGYDVSSEFYINDAGVQIEKLSLSAQAAIQIQEGHITKENYPVDAYPLDSMLDVLKPEIYKSKLKGYLDAASLAGDQAKEIAGKLAKSLFLDLQKKVLADIEVHFDTWYSENENLHQVKINDKNKIELICETLKAAKVKQEDVTEDHEAGENAEIGVPLHAHEVSAVYEEDSALWFRAKSFGDERDRVLRKSQGMFTYLAGDIAYHKDKFDRGFDKLINVWGSDHHGQELGIRGAIQAIGYNPDQLELIFIQLVSVKEDGVEKKMSKRKGTIVNVDELLAEVGKDALRFFLVDSQANNRMVFDLALAQKHDKDNPVYYIQYAHARSASIFRNLVSPRINIVDNTEEAAIFEVDELERLLNEEFKTFSANFKKLFSDEYHSEEQLKTIRSLVLELIELPKLVIDAADIRAPYKISVYLKNLASLFHQFYNENRIIGENEEVMKARLSLVAASKIVIKNALSILAISAPEKM